MPETQYEQFSLRDEQRELNHIYFGCLKKYDAAGYERIGKWGYAVALLGPPLSRAGGLAEGFASNGTEDGVEPAMIELKGTEMDPIFL